MIRPGGQSAASGTGSRIRFQVAEPEHDAALRQLSAVPMDGAIRISLERDPSFLAASVVEGDFRQTLVGVDRGKQQVVVMGSRSVRSRYLNGTAQPVGYLGALRCLEAERRQTVLARAYAFLKQIHGDGRASIYLTTIAADNEVALQALTSRRCGLPTYEPFGTYYTLAIGARRRRRLQLPAGLEVRSATEADRGCVVAFLRRMGARRQFAPQYEHADFFQPESTFRDLEAEDLRLAFRAGRLVGTLASWDQRGFKQTVVNGYGGALRWLRTGYNAWARLRRTPPLPEAGAPLRHRFLALPLALGDDPRVLRALLDRTLDEHAQRVAREPSCGLLLLGMHESDPLLPSVRPYGLRTYRTRLFVVHWDDGHAAFDALDARPVYLELGCL